MRKARKRYRMSPSFMSNPSLDILGIGNAIVDVIAPCDDAFLAAPSLNKGGMTRIEEAKAEKLYDAMGQTLVVSGGSAANTIIGAAALGARTGFIGKVKHDTLGEMFAHDIRAAKVAFETQSASDGAASARCLILVTPDGQRTMNTKLGACQALSEADVNPARVYTVQITYLEGYLWDPPAAKTAFAK